MEKKQLALKGQIPPAIFIFDAKNNSDYTDKIETVNENYNYNFEAELEDLTK